jgi:hypothetical protein
MSLREAAQQALEALSEIEWSNNSQWQSKRAESVIPALRAALEQPEQKPVAWIDNSGHPKHIRYWQGVRERQLYGPLQPLYTHPPRRREWRGLSEEEINEATFHPDGCMNTHIEFARAIEAALKERNA